MEILVFKTSVTDPQSIKFLKADLDRLAGKGKWNFDLSDCDRILRICSDIKAEAAIHLLHCFGYSCAELED
jgi:hypothetical protein